MDRFKIEDLVAQDKHGVVFRAKDSESGQVVAIRRFFPFGQNGGGLDKDEAAAYASASGRLAALEHESLRSIIVGAVDPIDQIPYLVTEWVEGDSLSAILSHETIEPALVIDVLRIALETSIILSRVLGEEAVWVETELDSIVVGTQESGRGFTFWISPFKWLGGQFESRKLSSIVTLGEELTGWKKKLVSDQAGHGLGGWLKWLRNNPETNLNEALESLAALTEKKASEPDKTAVVSPPAKPAVPSLRHSSSRSPLLVTAAIAVLVAGFGFFYYHKTFQNISPVTAIQAAPSLVAGKDAPEKSKPATHSSKPVPASAGSPPGAIARQGTGADRVNALAEKLSREASDASEAQNRQELKNKELLAIEKKAYERNDRILKPEQYHLARSFTTGRNIRIEGMLRSVRTSQSGKSIYLNFSDPYDAALTNAIAHKNKFKGTFKIQNFEKFIGRNVVIDGNVFIEHLRNAYFVKITSVNQISLAE